MSEPSEIHGALLIDKPAGPTSHDVVDVVRDLYRLKKVGHCGTLDPGATGLLVCLLGRATKLSQKLMAEDKAYEGAISLGATTDSYDADGQITETRDLPDLTLNALNAAAATFHGDQQQLPPMVSAVKKDGVALYKLARKGREVEREPKLVHIYQFEFTAYAPPVARFQVRCTKGTYVRSLAHELGQHLGCGAHLKHLHRTRSGTFDVADAIRLEALCHLPEGELPGRLMTLIDLARLLQPA
ncbi:MAG: tRNA pseudouridine(55) synthase TruB [Verrucomicrobiales bacterium]|nr:tRNA pseudouridine(55) synthase TruB [Verrucomicrobiales bacterium]|tara:strand:- start:60259 stop:60984 length:726 start_codon:yes stop_codon:yes gene_type:complete